jgi:hypothetical protein
VKLLVTVGAGVSEGEFVNRAQVMNAVTGVAMTGEATATVRLTPDATFDCTDVTGKVFDDINRNGLQDDWRTRISRRARRDSSRSGGNDRSVRAISHYLRNYA